MEEVGRYARRLNLKEGWLCLDFANTAIWHASPHPEEKLNSYNDLVAWAEAAGLLTAAEAQHLREAGERRPLEAATALQQAITLREAIYRIFSAIAHDRAPAPADLDSLNAALAEALAHLRVIPLTDGFAWAWEQEGDALEQPLWPIARSAAELLTSAELQRVGECADDRGCGWLFLDRSRNRTRRWCDMKDCGNRAKVRRYYEQQRATGGLKARGRPPGSTGSGPSPAGL